MDSAHRVSLAVPDFGGGLEKESGSLSGSKYDIDVAGLCCGVCGGLQPCVDRLEDVRLDEVVTYVTGGTQNMECRMPMLTSIGRR